MLWSYQLQRHKDYTCYNQLSRSEHELAWLLHDLPKCNLFHMCALATLLDKLYDLGLVLTHSLLCDVVRASSFSYCHLPTVLLKLRMEQPLQAALAFHVPLVTDPTFLVTCSMEDLATWVDSSKIKQ
ncbi:U3 small nucleolar ribonucleoprotein protein IMP3-like [Myotis lucifugus]|uniref:U3 small nucleolar ribonucleoprotein protein IMP3-like n=1 Tax=Myotis lucifugus TaxID=59463 RepID=UPI0006D72EAA|nr:U3 small nucleolar ribonucleoprotein protein IMP3-like [Myotis lucifugus]